MKEKPLVESKEWFEKTVFIDSQNVTLKFPHLILGSYKDITKKELKWWGSLKQQIESWEKERTGYYQQEIEIKGTGYKFEIESNKLRIDLGRSHEYLLTIPNNITFSNDKNITKIIKGTSFNKKELTQYLANIRKLFPLNTKGHGMTISPIEYKRREIL